MAHTAYMRNLTGERYLDATFGKILEMDKRRAEVSEAEVKALALEITQTYTAEDAKAIAVRLGPPYHLVDDKLSKAICEIVDPILKQKKAEEIKRRQEALQEQTGLEQDVTQ